MHSRKAEIRDRLTAMREENRKEQDGLSKAASLADCRSLVKEDTQDGERILIWTEAFQKALDENEIVRIPASRDPYYIDRPVLVPSGRRIEAEDGAVIRLKKGVRTLMLRNEHVLDGTHAPVPSGSRDRNICITGGRWEESLDHRAGYGRTGMTDEERSFYGVSTCMFFNNLDNLTLEHMTFAHTGGFAVQTGDLSNAVMHDITFVECYADGLHLNGNAENVWIRDIRGQCGDDLVALNAYDWQNSSVDFGPMTTVLCENLTLSEDSPYKAMRIQPGLYYFDDDSSVDCALYDVIVRNVKGIRTFKMYYQTPSYYIDGGEPERGAPGSGDWLFFEDITVDLAAPLDRFREYWDSDPVRGTIAAFEVGANIGHLVFENIRVNLYRDKYPQSFLLCAGPKSSVAAGDGKEIFDPYVSCTVDHVELEDIVINGKEPESIRPYLREIVFDDINHDGRSTGRGTFGEVTYRGKTE